MLLLLGPEGERNFKEVVAVCSEPRVQVQTGPTRVVTRTSARQWLTNSGNVSLRRGKTQCSMTLWLESFHSLIFMLPTYQPSSREFYTDVDYERVGLLNLVEALKFLGAGRFDHIVLGIKAKS